MAGTFLIVLVALIVGAAIWFGPAVALISSGRDGLGAVWMCAVGIVVVAATAAYIVKAKDDPNVHTWRGGAGHDTVCAYEERTVLVGKVPVRRTFTVCRDPEP